MSEYTFIMLGDDESHTERLKGPNDLWAMNEAVDMLMAEVSWNVAIVRRGNYHLVGTIIKRVEV